MPMSSQRQPGLPLAAQPAVPLLFRLAVPNLIATFVLSSLTVIEGWHVGRLGITELAGVALMFPIYMLTNMLSTGAIGGAVSGAAARAAGRQDREGIEAVLRAAIVIAISGGLLMSLLLWGFGRALFVLLGATEDVLAVALSYSRVFAIGLTLLWLYNMICAVLRGCGDMRTPAVTTFILAAAYFVLCPLMIFGTRWSPALNVAGAAAAILLVYALALSLVVMIVSLKHHTVRLRRGTIPSSTMMPILKNGLLASNQSVMTIFLALFTTALVGRLGTQWLAGYGIGVRLELLLIAIIFGVGGPLITIVGANVGAGQRSRALKIAWGGIGVIMLLIGTIGFGVALFPALWISLFTDDLDVANACRQYLQMVGPFYVFFALGLGLYFISQAFQTMVLPVAGTALRLLIVVGGGLLLIYFNAATPHSVYLLIAFSMVLYGLFIAIALRLGPWRPE